MFSKGCEYGIRAILHLGQLAERGEAANLRVVSRAIDSPEAFTAKILQSLANHGLITSVMGPKGGYKIDRTLLDQMTLSDIVCAIDGHEIYKKCGLGLEECDASKPCPIHFQFVAIRNDLRDMLESTKVVSLSDSLKEGVAVLKR